MKRPEQRPPLGLTPEYLYIELSNQERVKDILEAMIRYTEVSKGIPTEWIEELQRKSIIEEEKEDIKIERLIREFEQTLPNYPYNPRINLIMLLCEWCNRIQLWRISVKLERINGSEELLKFTGYCADVECFKNLICVYTPAVVWTDFTELKGI